MMQTVAAMVCSAGYDINGNKLRCVVLVHADVIQNSTSTVCIRDFGEGYNHIIKEHVINRNPLDVPVLHFKVGKREFKNIMNGALSGR